MELSARGIVGIERLRRRVVRAARSELESAGNRGIGNLQVTMLFALGSDRMTRAELARRLAVGTADLAKPLERLLDEDYVEQRPAGVRLTERGRMLRDRLIDSVEREVSAARLGYLAKAIERADLVLESAGPVVPQSYDPAKYVTWHTLKNKRHWSILLARQLLGPPDLVGLFVAEGTNPAKRLWLLSRVEQAELDPAFSAHRHRVVRIARVPDPIGEGYASAGDLLLEALPAGQARLTWGGDER